jgi:hypothetical protein
MITPGLKFFVDLTDLEGGPKRNELYLVCQDCSIQSVYSPGVPVGWNIVEKDNGWCCEKDGQLTSCVVRYHSRQDFPQFAEIIEQEDDGEEISSI